MSVFIAYTSPQWRSGSAPEAIAPVADSVLVNAMAAGNEHALSILYDRYSATVYGMLLRILKDKQTAEEVLQDLFLHIWRKPHQFDASRGCLRTWLIVVGRNCAISRLRASPNREFLEENDGDYAATFVSMPNIEGEISSLDMARTLRNALKHLPPAQRRALELAYFDGMSQNEIAQRTGSPLGTIKSRIRAALQSLKRTLEDDNGRRIRALGGKGK